MKLGLGQARNNELSAAWRLMAVNRDDIRAVLKERGLGHAAQTTCLNFTVFPQRLSRYS